MTPEQEVTRRVDEVETNLARTEFDFVSDVPVVGPLIQTVRRFWNNVATRWYVQHYVRQQMQYDRSVYFALRTIIARQEQLSAQIMDLAMEMARCDQELSARIHVQAQQMAFTKSLLDKDLQAVVQSLQQFDFPQRGENSDS
ncbi:MAG: hypothetical protein JXA33_13775 [Anaerolineae bacterium]|nr:hypothetical protein [Anaerolineae bacterium]